MQDLNRQLYDEISHREKAEFQLQFTKFAMDNASYMIIWINREGRFVYMNTKAREVLGFSTRQLASKNIFDLLSSDTRFSWNETWVVFIDGCETAFDLCKFGFRNDRSPFMSQKIRL